jgi:hypothetical protein
LNGQPLGNIKSYSVAKEYKLTVKAAGELFKTWVNTTP